MENNIIETIITGELEMVQAAIAKKYQTIRKNDMAKLKIDIVVTEKLTDPIYVTPEYRIIDGWKRLLILKELYEEDFKLAVKPTVIIVDTSEQQEDIYISKNVMVNRYKKSWLAVIAAENNLPETRRIAAARRGIKQTEPYDACTVAGLAFGVSGKTIQQADDILKSQYGEFLREKIRTEEITVDNAYKLVSRKLNGILDDMKNGRTYQEAANSFMRDEQGTREHNRFQDRQKQMRKNPLEYEEYMMESLTPTAQSENESIPTQVLAPISTKISTLPKTKSESKQSHFFGALSADCSPEFKNELEQLLEKHLPNNEILFIENRLKLQQVIHENNLSYTDIVRAA